MRSRPPALDVAAAIALAAFLVGLTPVSRVTQPAARPLTALGYALLAVAGLALAGRRSHPALTYALSVGAAVAYLVLGFPGWPVYIAALAGLAALVAGLPRLQWVPAAAVGGVAMAVASGRPEGWQPVRMAVVAVGWGVLAGFAGQAAETRRRRAAQEMRAQLVEERLRIARELHDVLSHSLATISMQAGVALHLLDRQPEQARTALTTIRAVSTEALGQARAALAAVRQPGTEPPGGAAERPGLDGIGRLVGLARAAGTAVDLDATPAVAVPEPVGAAVYRLVQESLTNVLRHAGPGARARVALRCREDGVEVEVTDNGTAAAAAGMPGHGLTGMRERITELGGQLEAGPAAGNGWRVRATIPIGPDRD